jgi:hypothetical protein
LAAAGIDDDGDLIEAFAEFQQLGAQMQRRSDLLRLLVRLSTLL